MSTITLKNLPGPLHRALRQRARRSHRSLNREILATLESAVAPQSRPVEEVLRDAEAFRSRLKIWAMEKDLTRYKREGRA